MTCRTTNDQPHQPTVTVHLHGRGDNALRMEKRLRCAGRALGVRVRIEWEPGDFDEARVSVANHLLAEGLVLLREYLDAENALP